MKFIDIFKKLIFIKYNNLILKQKNFYIKIKLNKNKNI